jgi:hypothetical protein
LNESKNRSIIPVVGQLIRLNLLHNAYPSDDFEGRHEHIARFILALHKDLIRTTASGDFWTWGLIVKKIPVNPNLNNFRIDERDWLLVFVDGKFVLIKESAILYHKKNDLPENS